MLTLMRPKGLREYMAKAKILRVVKASSRSYAVISNTHIFKDLWGGRGFEQVALMPAKDELDAWNKGKAIADEYNERVKAERQALRDKAKTD